MMRSVRMIVSSALFILISFLWMETGYSAEKSTRLQSIKFGTPSGPTMTRIVFDFGLHKEFYKREGIDLEMIQMKGSLLNMSFAAGGLDYSGSASGTIWTGAAGVPVKLIFVVGDRRPTFLVSKPHFNTIMDLKGKTIGVASIGDSEYLATKKVLRHFGLDPDKDVTLISTGPGAIKLQTLQAGSVDAVFLPAQVTIEAMKRGFKELVKISDYVGGLAQGIGVRQDNLKNKAIDAKRMVRATLKSMLYVRGNKNEVVDLAQKLWGGDKEALSTDYDMNIRVFTKDGTVREEDIKEEIETAKEAGVKVRDKINPADLIDFSIVREVKKELGL